MLLFLLFFLFLPFLHAVLLLLLSLYLLLFAATLLSFLCLALPLTLPSFPSFLLCLNPLTSSSYSSHFSAPNACSSYYFSSHSSASCSTFIFLLHLLPRPHSVEHLPWLFPTCLFSFYSCSHLCLPVHLCQQVQTDIWHRAKSFQAQGRLIYVATWRRLSWRAST